MDENDGPYDSDGNIISTIQRPAAEMIPNDSDEKSQDVPVESGIQVLDEEPQDTAVESGNRGLDQDDLEDIEKAQANQERIRNRMLEEDVEGLIELPSSVAFDILDPEPYDILSSVKHRTGASVVDSIFDKTTQIIRQRSFVSKPEDIYILRNAKKPSEPIILFDHGPAPRFLDIVLKIAYFVELSVAFVVYLCFLLKGIFAILYGFVFPVFVDSGGVAELWSGLTGIVISTYVYSAVLYANIYLMYDLFKNFMFFRRDIYFWNSKEADCVKDTQIMEAQLSTRISYFLQFFIYFCLLFAPLLTIVVTVFIVADWYFYFLMASAIGAVTLSFANYIKMRVSSHFICHKYLQTMKAIAENKDLVEDNLSIWQEVKYMIIGVVTIMRNVDLAPRRNYIIGHGDYWWMDVYTNPWRTHDHDTYSCSSGYPAIFAFLFVCETLVYIFIVGWLWFASDTNDDENVKLGVCIFAGIILFIIWAWRLSVIVRRFLRKEPKLIDTQKKSAGERMVDWEEKHCACCLGVPSISIIKLVTHVLGLILLIGGLACAFVIKWQFGIYFLVTLLLSIELYLWDSRHLSTTIFPDMHVEENTFDVLQGFNIKEKKLITPKAKNLAYRILGRDLFAFSRARKNILRMTVGFSILGFLLFIALGFTNTAATEPIGGSSGPPIAPYPDPGETITYMCGRTAAPNQTDYGLSLLDYAYFSLLSYYSPNSVDDVLKVWFGPEWSQEVPADIINVPNSVSFYDFYNSQLNVSVVTTRGTFNMYDWVQDAAIWMEAVCFQAYESIFFFGSIYSDIFPGLIRGINAVYLVEKPTIDSQRSFYGRAVLDYTRNILPQRKDVIMSGHSLGGGIAQIVGSALSLRVFGMSGPGILYSRGKYGLEQRVVEDKVINVQPELDLVPQFDRQSIQTQHTLCSLGIFSCHSIQLTLCEIQRICGDPRGRLFSLDPPFQCKDHRAKPPVN